MLRPGHHAPSVRSAWELLGVGADADPAEVSRAYRRQARHLHPDVSLEPDATERFWALQAAYHLALETARGNASTPAAVPAPAEHRDPTVVVDVAPVRGVRPSPSRGRENADWLVAGPVRVQPPQGPDRAPRRPHEGGGHE